VQCRQRAIVRRFSEPPAMPSIHNTGETRALRASLC
jgi:hypothetical protein